MNTTRAILALTLFATAAHTETMDPLPSWTDGATKERIVRFVDEATTPGTGFVPEAERVAVFDNDGTLWVEQPIYTQLIFAFDRIKVLAPQHPEWSEREPFKSAVEGDAELALAGGEKAVLELIMGTHANMTTEEFEGVVSRWVRDARHPLTKRPYTDMVYQPMLELLTYLKTHGFKNYIVSGGGVEFMRPWSEAVYGIPPEQVIGSCIKVEYEMTPDGPVLRRQPEVAFIDDGPGKPVGIHRVIGRRPLVAFGNSDGDLQMLQWTAAGKGARLTGLIHHTDREREWSYDRDSHIGKLDKALNQAREKDWLVVDMREDWKVIYPSDLIDDEELPTEE